MAATPDTSAGGAGRVRPPVSTYRLQFHSGFRFADAAELVPYLHSLGVTDCYSSPFLKASPGSTHGYDICDHTRLNPGLGDERDYASFSRVLTTHRMGHIVDFVPNHMGVDPVANPWWRDVLQNGRCSAFAPFFDIDWEPIKADLHGKVLLPILGDQYGAVLERAELRLVFADGTFTIRYFEHDLPLDPGQLTMLLDHDIDSLRRDLGDEHPSLLEYLSIATALRNLPPHTERDDQRVAERHREGEVARNRLRQLVEAAPRIAQHIAHVVRTFNGNADRPDSFDRLHALLDLQPYRVAYWRTAGHEVNYRRFFDINQLAGLCMENPRVFEATHSFLLSLVATATITGLRIDHVDGLFDPLQYLERLQAAAQVGHNGSRPSPFYVVTEKVLSSDEALPEHWPVAGTSGYDFLNDLNGIFVDCAHYRALRRVYDRFTHATRSFEDIVYDSKKLIMDAPMASELNVLASALDRLSERDRHTRDFTLNSLREVLREIVACFPIYRTYVTRSGFTREDQQAIDTALRRARRRNATMESTIFDFVRSVLLADRNHASTRNDREQRTNFAMKFQQYTSPVQAKGVEDTAFYRYNLLLSLNEVGGTPERFGCTPEAFHAANRHRRAQWPTTMLATATHDTKRGEDVRARLNVLSEIPQEWSRCLSAWARINASNRTIIEGRPAPDRNDEYFLYQTLLGVWPAECEAASSANGELVDRLREYLRKAMREAKVHTSWTSENRAYEDAVLRFLERTLTGPTAARFLAAFGPFQSRIAHLGMVNSLAQLVLKVASPGVPDFYRGTELWDLTLVDPDNRRPVDYGLRKRLLAELQPLFCRAPAASDIRVVAAREMLARWTDGRIKLFLTTAALRLRRARAALFLAGTYEALAAHGPQSQHVVAFARRHGPETVIAVVPRLLSSLTTATHPLPLGPESWGDTRLPLPVDDSTDVYRNVFTLEPVVPAGAASARNLPLAAVLQTCPVALLVPARSSKEHP